MATMRRTPRGYARACRYPGRRCTATARAVLALGGHRVPAREPGPKKMHRIGGASVQLTRSTFAEATAGRESLRPSALRARCTRKSRRGILSCQARERHTIVANSGNHVSEPDSAEVRRLGPYSNAKMHRGPVLRRPAPRLTAAEATACRRAINLGRSVLGALGTLGARNSLVKRFRNHISALCEFFFTTGHTCVEPRVLYMDGTKDSPSRVRFRPLPRLTFRFRVRPPGRASS